MHRVKIKKLIRSKIAVSYIDGRIIAYKIQAIQKRNKKAILDFKGIEQLSVRFVETALEPIFKHSNYHQDHLDKYISFENITQQHTLFIQMILRNIQYYKCKEQES